jgi:glycosyltransferase involved in cell wall biosynthesis
LPNKNWLRKKFGFTDATIIHAGRLAAERNIDVIIKAMPDVLKKIPTAQLALVGRGVAEKDLELLAKKLGVANSVRFLGFLEKPALAEAYNASKIFVITSTSDTQSMVMMQAMASGLPIIGVKARALPEYINSKNGILIEPGDEKTLAKKIILLLKEAALRKKLALGARNFANKFSAPEVAKEWEEIYGKVIKDYNNDK